MNYQTVRALQAIRHNGILRIPGQATGANAQDFVVDELTATRLTSLGFASTIGPGVPPEPDGVSPEEEALLVASGVQFELPVKMRNMFSRCYNNNAVINTPWYKSPTWKNAEVVTQGVVRSGTDGICEWVAQGFTGGDQKTAAAGNGPTGGPIFGRTLDSGGIIWECLGPVRGQYDYPTAGNVSASNPYPYVVDTDANIQAAMGTGFQTFQPRVGSLGQFTLSGGILLAQSYLGIANLPAAYNPNSGNSTTGVSYAPGVGSCTFYTDSNLIGLISADFVYPPLNGTPIIRVEVDDRLVFDSTMISANTNPFKPGGFLLNLSKIDMTGGRKVRIWGGLEVFLSKVYLQAYASIWKYENPNRFSIAVEGTSIDADTFGPGWSWPEMLASRIGADGVFNFAQGSTGYLSNNNGTRTNMLDRLPALVATGADIVILGGPHNDSSFSKAAQQAQYTLYLNSLLSQMPKAKIITSGCLVLQGAAYGVGSNLYNAEANLFEVVDQINNPRITKLPILTASPWITGSGSGDTPANNGNMDKYYTHNADHPNTKANFYFSQRYAQALASIAADW